MSESHASSIQLPFTITFSPNYTFINNEPFYPKEFMENEERSLGAQVIAFPFPAQGHINPILQFSKRLTSKGLKVTIAITRFLNNSTKPDTGSVGLELISDGYDEGGFAEAESADAYSDRFKAVGSKTLKELIEKQRSSCYPVKCIVYDSHIPWALDVAKELGLIGAAFFTQSCAVDTIYCNVHQGLLNSPPEGPTVSIPGLPLLGVHELPSFIYAVGSYPSFRTAVLSQFSNFEKAEWLLFNSFDKLENKVVNWMKKQWPTVRTIGPCVPSMYVDKRVEGDKDHGLNLFKLSTNTYMKWLDAKEAGSVVYVSFGSLATLGEEQTKELALGLKNSHHYFLWVLRDLEKNKLPSKFLEETVEKGLVVNWCSQLEVLAHEAIGCFVTHCGWNSTLEALSLGVPMVAMPQWTDQTTNAKFIIDVWEVGVRVKVEKGIVRREEIELCIKDVMEGEKGKMFKRNAIKWKELAKEAIDEGGSSDKNIDEFVTSLV